MFFIQQESIPSLYVKNCHRLANPTPDLKIRFWAHFCGIIFYKKNDFKNFRRQIMFDFLTFAQCWILHCPKSVRIRSSSGLHFSCIFPHSDCIRLRISPYSVRMRENTGKMRTRITPNTDTFYAVLWSLNLWNKVNLEHSTIAVWNLAQSWSISKCFLWRRKIGSFCFTNTSIVIFVYCLYKGLYIRYDFC